MLFTAFTGMLLQKFFSEDEVSGNCHHVGKVKLDGEKLNVIYELLYKFYPGNPENHHRS